MLKQNVDFAVYKKNIPTEDGFFGSYGGAFIPPQLVSEFEKISAAYQTICKSSKFISELRRIRKEFQGRPTPTYYCERLSTSLGKCQIYLKREDLIIRELISSIIVWEKVFWQNISVKRK